MERVYAFLPSILFIACIAGAAFLYLRWVVKRFGDNFKSVEWHQRNQWKVVWTVGTPLVNVLTPAVEELIFRAPLIIAFSTMSSVAWYGICASSGLFALSHWFGKKVWMPEILSTRKNGSHETNDVVAEMNRLHKEKGEGIKTRKALHVIFTLPLGILTGYYGIKCQSLWVAFWIHSAWNLVMPFVLSVLLPLGVLAFIGASSLRDRMKWRRKLP